MKFLKEIFGRIWALWAIIVFVATMLIFYIPFLLFVYTQKEPLRTHRFILYSRTWMTVFLNLIGCPLKKNGLKNFKKDQSYIVLCNHNSFMDVPVSSPAIPGGNKTIAKIEMAKIPVFNLIYKSGSVLVDRKSEKSRKDSYNKMKRVLEMGLHMCIYPEGTRNKSNEPLKAFHSGAFKLCIETGKPIIPSLIFNTRKVLPATKTFYCMPHSLRMDFLPPVSPLPNETVEELKNRVYEIMKNYYVQHT
jgi:1-acyl-sn-glycerol-3-phosphate acyltransferase